MFISVTVNFFFFKESAEEDAGARVNCLSTFLVEFFIEFVFL